MREPSVLWLWLDGFGSLGFVTLGQRGLKQPSPDHDYSYDCNWGYWTIVFMKLLANINDLLTIQDNRIKYEIEINFKNSSKERKEKSEIVYLEACIAGF